MRLVLGLFDQGPVVAANRACIACPRKSWRRWRALACSRLAATLWSGRTRHHSARTQPGDSGESSCPAGSGEPGCGDGL